MGDLMTETDAATASPDDALERLLKEASPRPVPSSDDVAEARHAVRAEWRKVANQQRSRRRLFRYAIAASVLLGTFAVFNAFRAPPADVVTVASIQKSAGSIYLLGDAAELRQTEDLSSVSTGQTIVTGSDAGMALAWGGGGSLRVDENTRIEFIGRDAVYLHSGRVYFDSRPPALSTPVTASDSASFAVQTDYGRVTHTGTQFMTQAHDDALIVSVREGEVAVANELHRHTARPGEQVTLLDQQRPSVLRIGVTGGDWEWAGRLAPAVIVDGRPLVDFLRWAAREMGLRVEFEGGAEAIARQAILRGRIDTDPAEALRLRLSSAALAWRIEAGVIYISSDR